MTSSTSGSAPASPASNQRILGSRRKKASCRRASALVRFTVPAIAASSVSSPAR